MKAKKSVVLPKTASRLRKRGSFRRILGTFAASALLAVIGTPGWADVVVDTTNGTIVGDGEYAADIALDKTFTVTPSGDTNAINLSGAISGATYGLTIASGQLTLSGANTYSGGTTISAGTLRRRERARLLSATPIRARQTLN